jgi:predicted nucleic-acid-binding protein
VTAVDTNVLVRIVVNDDATQAARARALMDSCDKVFLSRTVLLELAWVLASSQYRLDRDTVSTALRTLLAIPNVEMEAREAVMTALDWFERGMDFADALHLASTDRETEFATFDLALERIAVRLGIGKVVAI